MRTEHFPYVMLPNLDDLLPMFYAPPSSPIFIPRKHTKMKYADHKRMKAKRRNIR